MKRVVISSAVAALAAFAFADRHDSARNTMNYRIRTVGVWHQYEKGRIDWKFNPTYNNYLEYVWQLGRFDFLPELARYYAETKDPEAAKTFMDMVSTWIDQANYDEKRPNGGWDGVCWRSLDAGIRVKNWSVAWNDFRDAPELTEPFRRKFFDSLRLHGRHLAEFNTSRNWLLYEMTGLVYLAATFPELAESKEWMALAVRKLEGEIDRQVYPDGFHYELACGYHGSLDRNYTQILDYLAAHGCPQPAFVEKGLDRAFDLYEKLMRPDGTLPALNDSGNPSSRLALKRALRFYPNREDYRFIATNGRQGTAPPYNSIALEYSGAVVMRTGWGEKDIWAYMDAGPIGAGHQHEDKLNVLLYAYGRELLRDGGIYQYDTSDMRQYVLSTRSHNTIRIDGMDQSRRQGYRWKDEYIGRKADFRYSFGDDVEWVRAAYVGRYGYLHGSDRPVEAGHKRLLAFYKRIAGLKPFFVVIDTVGAKDEREHDYEILWHLEECESYRMDERTFVADFGGGVTLSGYTSADRLVDRIGDRTPHRIQGWKPVHLTGAEHEHTPIHTPSTCGKFTRGKRIVTVLYPSDAGESPIAAVRSSDDRNATGFTIELRDGRKIDF